MIGSLIKHLIHLAIYVIVFFGAVWLFLGMPPQETYTRSSEHLGKLFGRASKFSRDFGNTAIEMKHEADSQLQQASDRFHGKDPYERQAHRFDEMVGKGGEKLN